MTGSAVSVRRAGPDDADAVLALALAFARSHGYPADMLDADTVRRHMLEAGATMTVFLAECGGEAAGYIAFSASFDSSHASPGCYVSELFVIEPLRGRGIARLLMARAARIAARQSGAHLWLTMEPDNAAADRFYRRIADIREDIVAYAITGEHLARLASGADGDGEKAASISS